MASTALLGALNYGYTLLVAHLLPPEHFAGFAGLSSLLLLVATASAAVFPWVLARQVSTCRDDPAGRREAVGFALGNSVWAASGAAPLVVVLSWRYATPGLWALAAVCCLSMFVTSVAAGYNQGLDRFGRFVALRFVEFTGKAVTGLGAALATRSAAGALLGLAAGSTLSAAYGLWTMRGEIQWRSRGRGRPDLWRHALGTGAIQALVVLQQTLDVIVLGIVVGGTQDSAAYQAMIVLARVPVFVSTAVSLVAFPRLVRSHADSATQGSATRDREARRALGTYLLVCGPLSAVIAVLPRPLLSMVLPGAYLSASDLLVPLALAGLAVGLLNVATTCLQAGGDYLGSVRVLAGCEICALGILSAAGSDLTALAWSSAATASAVAVASLIRLRLRWPGCGIPPQVVTVAAAVSAIAVLTISSIGRTPPSTWEVTVFWEIALGLATGLGLAVAVLVARVAHRMRRTQLHLPDNPEEALGIAVRDATAGRGDGRVLLIGNYGNGNTGDESILTGLLGLVANPDVITVVSRNPDRIRTLHGVHAVPTVSVAALMALIRARAVCVGGGGMFGLGLPPLVRVLPLAMVAASLMGRDTYFLSIGTYANTPPMVTWALRLAAATARAVTVREAESRQVLGRGLGARKPATLVVDPSLLVRPTPAQEVLAHLGITSPPIVVSVKAVPDQHVMDALLDALADGLARAGARQQHPVVFLCLSAIGDYGLGPTHADRPLSERVMRAMGPAAAATVVGPDLPPALAKGICAAARAVVAMRLHAQIFAVTTGTPLLGIPFENKSRAWLAGVGAEGVPADQLTGQGLARWLSGVPSDTPGPVVPRPAKQVSLPSGGLSRR